MAFTFTSRLWTSLSLAWSFFFRLYRVALTGALTSSLEPVAFSRLRLLSPSTALRPLCKSWNIRVGHASWKGGLLFHRSALWRCLFSPQREEIKTASMRALALLLKKGFCMEKFRRKWLRHVVTLPLGSLRASYMKRVVLPLAKWEKKRTSPTVSRDHMFFRPGITLKSRSNCGLSAGFPSSQDKAALNMCHHLRKTARQVIVSLVVLGRLQDTKTGCLLVLHCFVV